MNLGKVYIESNNIVINKVRNFTGLRKSVTLTIKPYSGKTTVEVCGLIKKGSSLTRDESAQIIEVISDNIPIYIDLIIVACRVPDNIKKVVSNSISQTWTLEEIGAAAQLVYNQIDFQSAFMIMEVMGHLRFEDEL